MSMDARAKLRTIFDWQAVQQGDDASIMIPNQLSLVGSLSLRYSFATLAPRRSKSARLPRLVAACYLCAVLLGLARTAFSISPLQARVHARLCLLR
jgi:hypothetical protein